MRRVSLGIIGLGRHGTRYAGHILSDINNGKLVAVCRRNEKEGKAFAEEKGVRFYKDYPGLIKDSEVEAVVIVTTPNMNCEIATLAAREGKHILLEKPFAVNAKEAGAIIKEAKKSNIRLMAGQTLRYNPVVREMKKRKDEIGPIHTISMNQRYEAFDKEWAMDAEIAGGGNILHLGVHIFDAMRWFTGDEVKTVYCETANIFTPRLEDSFVAVLRLTKGTKCLVDSCRYTESRSGRIELVGEKGQLIGDFVHNSLFMIKGREMVPVPVPEDTPTIKDVLEDFCGSIINDAVPPITGEDGLKTIEIADACYLSARKKREISL
jgi:predicted dehydrogenase